MVVVDPPLFSGVSDMNNTTLYNRVIDVLKTRTKPWTDKGGLSAQEIASAIGVPDTRIARTLSILVNDGVITCLSSELHTHYRANRLLKSADEYLHLVRCFGVVPSSYSSSRFYIRGLV